jgi:ABC-type uncharacterized transport system permease subunit
MVMLQKFDHATLVQEVWIQLGWIAALFILNRVAFARGVRRYAAHGG